MQDRHTYKYAVIRFLPRVEREEFFNVGVILFCKRMKYLDIKYFVSPDKLKAFSPEIELEEINEYLNSWKIICEGGKAGGPIGDLAGWLLAEVRLFKVQELMQDFARIRKKPWMSCLRCM